MFSSLKKILVLYKRRGLFYRTWCVYILHWCKKYFYEINPSVLSLIHIINACISEKPHIGWLFWKTKQNKPNKNPENFFPQEMDSWSEFTSFSILIHSYVSRSQLPKGRKKVQSQPNILQSLSECQKAKDQWYFIVRTAGFFPAKHHVLWNKPGN